MAELAPKDRAALAAIYESDDYKALKRWIENERFNIATKLLLWPASDSVEIARFQGQAHALKMLNLELKNIHKEQVEHKN